MPVLDNGEITILWIGSTASPQLLIDLLGVEDIASIDTHIVSPLDALCQSCQ